jgi:hypothetical protein
LCLSQWVKGKRWPEFRAKLRPEKSDFPAGCKLQISQSPARARWEHESVSQHDCDGLVRIPAPGVDCHYLSEVAVPAARAAGATSVERLA